MHEHFKTFVTQVKAENLPVPVLVSGKRAKVGDYLVVLAESSEVADHLIDSAAGEILKTSGDQLLELHITDQ